MRSILKVALLSICFILLSNTAYSRIYDDKEFPSEEIIKFNYNSAQLQRPKEREFAAFAGYVEVQKGIYKGFIVYQAKDGPDMESVTIYHTNLGAWLMERGQYIKFMHTPE